VLVGGLSCGAVAASMLWRALRYRGAVEMVAVGIVVEQTFYRIARVHLYTYTHTIDSNSNSAPVVKQTNCCSANAKNR
jgi:hypothetical protein